MARTNDKVHWYHWPETQSSRLVAARLEEEVGRLTWEPFNWFKRPFIVYFFGPGKNGLTSKMASKLRCHEPTSSQATCFKENREKKKKEGAADEKVADGKGVPSSCTAYTGNLVFVFAQV